VNGWTAFFFAEPILIGVTVGLKGDGFAKHPQVWFKNIAVSGNL
jgi:hypothetical protein